MTLNELFAIQEADVTKEFLLKAGWSEIAEEPAEIFRRSRMLEATKLYLLAVVMNLSVLNQKLIPSLLSRRTFENFFSRWAF